MALKVTKADCTLDEEKPKVRDEETFLWLYEVSMGLKKSLVKENSTIEDLHLNEMKNPQKISFLVRIILTLVLIMVVLCQYIC